MMKYKKISIIIIISFFFLLLWPIFTSTNLGLYNNDYYEAIFQTNAAKYGYSSVMNYSIIYMLPFLVGLNLFLPKETITWTIHMKRRNNIIKKRMPNTFQYVLCFTFIHTIVNVINMFLAYPAEELLKSHYLVYESIHFIGVFAFYLLASMLFLLLSDSLGKREHAIVGIQVTYLLYYFINRIFLCYDLIKNIAIKELLFKSGLLNFQVYAGILQLFFLVIIASVADVLVYQRKDII